MAEAGAGGGQGGGESGQGGTGGQQVDAATARAFVSQFVPDPKIIERLPEPDVIAYHGKVKTAVDTAVQNAIKERGEWGPDWKQRMAKDNPDALKTLERFNDPTAVWDSYAALRGKLSSGELKAVTPYPKDGTPEQQTAWRAEQGIPTDPKGYKVELPAGVVLGEDDQPYVDGFLQHAHKSNLPPQAVNAALTWWGEERARRAEAAAVANAQVKQETEDKLRSAWGEEFRPTMNRIQSLLDANLPAGSELRGKILNTVDTSAEFANLMASIATQINPVPSLPGAGAESQVSSIGDWLSKADKMMRTDRKAYNNSEYSRDYGKYATAYKSHTGKEWGKG